MALVHFLRQNARWLSAACLMTFASGFGQTFYIAVFAGKIRADFDLSHGQWGGLYSLATMASAATMIFVGGLTDRFRARSLGALSMGLLGLACLAMSAISSVAALALVIFALRFAGQGMTSHTALVATSRWFVAARGRALAIASLGFSLAEAVLPLTFVTAMAFVDWRVLWQLAALVPILAIPVLLVLLRVERTPRADPEVSVAAGMDGRHWTRAEMLRNPVFWMVAPMLMAPTCFGTALIFQQVHLTASKGWDLVEFVALFPLYTACIVAGVMLTGWAIDRWGAVRLMPIYQAPLALSYLLFWQAETLAGATVAFVFFGLGTGTHGPTSNAFWAEVFGTRHLGTIRAVIAALLVLGSALGPGFSGFLIDAGVLFSDQMPWFVAYILATSALTWAAVARVRPRLAAAPKIDVIGAGPAMADVGLGHLQHDRPEGR